jgi:hypothetical protein
VAKEEYRHEQKILILVVMAHEDDQGVVSCRSMNDKRQALIGTGLIESSAYMYPNKSIRMPDPMFPMFPCLRISSVNVDESAASATTLHSMRGAFEMSIGSDFLKGFHHSRKDLEHICSAAQPPTTPTESVRILSMN